MNHPRVGHPISRKRRKPKLIGWARYEELKREWVAKNPTPTPAEYTVAMQEIARRARV